MGGAYHVADMKKPLLAALAVASAIAVTGAQTEKIDYANMAKVDRAVAAGILRIANAVDTPKWTR